MAERRGSHRIGQTHHGDHNALDHSLRAALISQRAHGAIEQLL
jgi:hypothetical protein